jgi:hypothetical protein
LRTFVGAPLLTHAPETIRQRLAQQNRVARHHKAREQLGLGRPQELFEQTADRRALFLAEPWNTRPQNLGRPGGSDLHRSEAPADCLEFRQAPALGNLCLRNAAPLNPAFGQASGDTAF